jgi:pSer/pThr/pTyr-binding forkhead associated (FHA) protein
MYLIVVNDERGALVSEQELSSELSIGRTSENAIILPDSAVSRKHAIIYMDHNTVFIEDLGSANGIYIDDVRAQGTMQITEENQIRIGTYRVFLERLAPMEQRERGGYQTAVVHPSQAHGKLVVINGPQMGKEFYLFEPIITIGRTEEKEVTIAHVSVSRHHAQIKKEDNGSYIITDPHSSNGTFVKGKRVKNGLRARHGDKVRFGQIECLLVDPMGQSKSSGASWTQYALIVVAIVSAIALGWNL